uniref:Uncharacterized protein n=1 Tax=Buteo japonicus TaxID=224669 RepID=A0A8C0B1A6_9AVES
MALALVGDLRWAGNRRKYDSIIKQIPNQLRAPGAGGGMSDLAPNGAEQHDGSLCKQNYGGVYVGLPSDAAAMVSSQTKATPKGIGRLRFAFLLLPQFNFIY